MNRTGFKNQIQSVVLILLIALIGNIPVAADDTSVESMVARVQQAFWHGEYPATISMAQTILASEGLEEETRAEVHKILAAAFTMNRARKNALDNLVQMFNLDPTARYSPDTNYPPPVLNNYYAVRDSLFSGTMDIRTVAVGDFENNSIYTGKFKNYNFDALKNALPHIITQDLTEITDLKIVDRQRTAEILGELQLSSSGFTNPEQAVQVGQLLGAHSFIFGQYMMISEDEIRIDARIVQTATGEVISARQITGKFGGKPELFLELERKLITELMATLSTALGSEVIEKPEEVAKEYFAEKKKDVKKREGYVDGVFLTSQALEAEKQGDYAAAVDNWKAVLAADPKNEVAAIRVKILTPLAQG
jgi:TolB-like protein